MRRQFGAMKHPEMLGDFLVAAHRIGHTRTSIDATQSGADEREEDGEGFDQHKSLAMSTEERVAKDNHHVADWSSGAFSVAEAIGVTQEVIRCEVLYEVHEQTLDREREEHAARNVLGRILRFLTQCGN